jgi:hypothetical protein
VVKVLLYIKFINSIRAASSVPGEKKRQKIVRKTHFIMMTFYDNLYSDPDQLLKTECVLHKNVVLKRGT